MSSPPLGFGLAPMGVSPFGYGAVATADVPTGKPFTKSDGTSGDARWIDPLSLDYQIDPETGLALGEDGVAQLVYLALLTVKGSSAVSTLGQEFSKIQLVTENTAAMIQDLVRQALSKLVTDGLIEITDIDVQFVTVAEVRRCLLHVQWRDLTRSKNNVSTLPL